MHPSAGTVLGRMAVTSWQRATGVLGSARLNSTQAAREATKINSANRDTYSFQELGIDKDLYDKTTGIRFRQHVNPLKKELQEPTRPLDWSTIYENPSKPLILDIGAGYGRFLLGLMQVDGFAASNNALGLEIREPIIKRANEWAMHLGLDSRVHFVRSNATVSIESMLSTYPGPVELVTIQFPDPHFKKKHRKRRIVQEGLVKDLASVVGVGGKVLLQSDVLGVAEDMRDKFERHGDGRWVVAQAHDEAGSVFFEESASEDQDGEGKEGKEGEQGEGGNGIDGADHIDDEVLVFKEKGWLKENPLPVRTERECLVMEQGGSVYRVLLERV